MTSVFLFDLYGTLVPAGTNEARDAVAREVAATIGVDGDRFAELYRSTFDARTKGLLGDLVETFAELARRLGGSPERAQLERAAAIRLTFARRLLEPRSAEGTLQELKAAGYRLGLVTDCSIETPLSWDSSWLRPYFEQVAFSCEIGLRKPDPRIYLFVTSRLNVATEECVFVGDDGSNELSGARSLGMTAIQVDEHTSHAADRNDEEVNWVGDSIHHLGDLIGRYV